MVEDITDTFIKKYRQKYCDQCFDVLFLKEKVYNKCIPDGIVKNYCKYLFEYQNEKKVFRVTDHSFKNCLLNEANRQLDKALYNWSIYKRLVSKGLKSWGTVTLYYAQYYSVIGLLNLQGTSFSRPQLKYDGLEREVQFHIYPEDYSEGRMYFEIRDLRKPHEDLWRQYYATYHRFDFNLKKFNKLYQYDLDNQLQPTCIRNYANYDIAYKLIEYISFDEILDYANKMKCDIFEIADQDDEDLSREYIASLRINLLFDLINTIMSSSNLILINIELNKKRKNMLVNTKDNTPVQSCFSSWINIGS